MFVHFFKPSKCISEKRIDITTKKIKYFVQKMWKKKKQIFYYHWIFVNPVESPAKQSTKVMTSEYFAINSVLLTHTCPVMLNELKLIK